MNRRFSTDTSRRTFLKITGAGGAAGLAGLAGCSTQVGDENGGDDGNGGGGGNESGNATGNESGGGSGGSGEQIIAGTAPGFPPFEMKDENGELVGFDVDLLEAVVEPTSYTIGEWKTFEFSSLIPALRNDRIDVIAAALTINEDRKESIAFSNPYYSADQAVLVADDGDFSPSSLDDLSGHKIGAQEGTTGADVVKGQLIANDKLQQSNFNTYGSYVLSIEDLENGNVDAVVLDKPVAETFASQRDVSVAFVYETGEEYGFGIRQDASELQSALNSGLEEVRGSGTYEEIRNEWFSGSATATTESGNASAGSGNATAGSGNSTVESGNATGTGTTSGN